MLWAKLCPSIIICWSLNPQNWLLKWGQNWCSCEKRLGQMERHPGCMCTEGQPCLEAARGWSSASKEKLQRTLTSQRLVSCLWQKMVLGACVYSWISLSSLSEKRPTWALFLPCDFLISALVKMPKCRASALCPIDWGPPSWDPVLGRSVWCWLLGDW